jgi:hypothetical protein
MVSEEVELAGAKASVRFFGNGSLAGTEGDQIIPETTADIKVGIGRVIPCIRS